MKTEQHLQEDLLYAWMEMSVFIRGNRILADLSFNEVMICGMLSRRQADAPLTATELGERTNLLKSQINHILTAMEQRGLVERTRVMEILKAVYGEFGSEKTRELTAMLKKATSIVNNYMDPNATSKEN